MGQLTREDIQEEARARKERILSFITQDPPVPYNQIRLMEGMHDRACRQLIKEIEDEHGLDYLGTPASKTPKDALPYGLTSSTAHFRGRLGDHLYQLRHRGNNHDNFGRNQVAPRVGLNARQQLKAEERPFAHDWTLSQIERLARELGENPVDFMIKCLTT
jgi:hypothetical protein